MGIIGASLLTTYLLIMGGIVALMVPVAVVAGRSAPERTSAYQAVATSLGLTYADDGNRWKGMLPGMTGHLDGIRVTAQVTKELESRPGGYGEGVRTFHLLIARPVSIKCDFEMRASTTVDRAMAFAGRQPIQFDDGPFDSRVEAVSPNEPAFREHMTEPRRLAAWQIIEQYNSCVITRKELRIEIDGSMEQHQLERVLRLLATTARTLGGDPDDSRILLG